MSFLVKNISMLDNYSKIWNEIKSTLNVKFHSMPVSEKKYMKVKVKEFNDAIKTLFRW